MNKKLRLFITYLSMYSKERKEEKSLFKILSMLLLFSLQLNCTTDISAQCPNVTLELNNPGCKEIRVYAIDAFGESHIGGLIAGVIGAQWYLGPGTYLIRDRDGNLLETVIISNCNNTQVITVNYPATPTLELNNPGCREIALFKVTNSGEQSLGALWPGVTGALYYLDEGTYVIRDQDGNLLETIVIFNCITQVINLVYDPCCEAKAPTLSK